MIKHSLGFLLSIVLVVTQQCLGIEPKKPCSAQLTPTTSCAPCSLTKWSEKISLLKERPVEFSSLPSKKEYQSTILTLNELLSTLQNCANVMAQTIKSDAMWLGKKSYIR